MKLQAACRAESEKAFPKNKNLLLLLTPALRAHVRAHPSELGAHPESRAAHNAAQVERGQNHDESPKEKEQERERNYERGRRERRNTMWWGVVAD